MSVSIRVPWVIVAETNWITYRVTLRCIRCFAATAFDSAASKARVDVFIDAHRWCEHHELTPASVWLENRQ